MRIMTLHVQNVHRWLTHVCNIHKADQIKWSASINLKKTCFWLQLQLVIRFQHYPQTW